MSFIYHLKPEPFIGDELIPLNLMDKNTDLYKSNAKKYVGREKLMEEIIPKLNCKWNDVVQFSSISPQALYDELKLINPKLNLVRQYYFKIHIDDLLKQGKVVIFEGSNKNKSKSLITLDSEVKIITHENYNELIRVPQETIDYWTDAYAKKGKLLWFVSIPHIFFKGKVKTENFEVCKFVN